MVRGSAELTIKQRRALNAAPANRRQAMAAGFRAQPRRTQGRVPPQPTLRRSPQVALRRVLPQGAIRKLPARGTGPAPIAKDLWDPLNKTPIPVAFSDGKAKVVTGLAAHSLELKPTMEALVMCSNVGDAGCVGVMIKKTTQGGSSTYKVSNFVCPTLAENAVGAVGPTTGRAMKASCSITNLTPPVEAGGEVTWLASESRLESDFDIANITDPSFNDLKTSIKEHAQARVIDGSAFKVGRVARCSVANTPEYITFSGWYKSTTCDDVEHTSMTVPENHTTHKFLQTVTTGDLQASALAGGTAANPNTAIVQGRRPMNTQIFFFDSPANTQNYSLRLRGTFYTRWPHKHVMGQQHDHMPTRTGEAVSRIIDHGAKETEKLGVMLEHTAEARAAQEVRQRMGVAAGAGVP